MDNYDEILRSKLIQEMDAYYEWSDPPAWWFALQGIKEGKLGPLAEVFRAAGDGDKKAIDALLIVGMLFGEELASFLRGEENSSGVVVATKAGEAFSKITETPARKSASMLRELKIYRYALSKGLERKGQYESAINETAKHFNKSERSIRGSVTIAKENLRGSQPSDPFMTLLKSPAFNRLNLFGLPLAGEDN